MNINQLDNNKTIDVVLGDTIVIRLPENPTTGYVWESTDYQELFTLQATDYVAASPALGSPGTRSFSLLAKQTGTATLHFKLWRAWEGDSSIVETFTVTIQINDK